MIRMSLAFLVASFVTVFIARLAFPDQNHAQMKMPSEHAPFKLSLERAQLIGLRYGTVEKKPLSRRIRASGRVAFDPDLYTAENEYVQALRQLHDVERSPVKVDRVSAERTVNSARIRLKILGLSDSQIKQLGSAKSPGKNLLLPSPGEAWVYGEIYEVDLPYVQPGMEVEVSAPYLEGKVLSGQVIAVNRVIDPKTRTATARVHINNTELPLRPETYVNVTAWAPLGEQVTVPADSIMDLGTEAWAFIAHPDGTIEPRTVTIKFRTGNQVAILKGLSPGERIVASANFLIDSESRLKSAIASSEKAPGGPPQCPKGKRWDPAMQNCM